MTSTILQTPETLSDCYRLGDVIETLLNHHGLTEDDARNVNKDVIRLLDGLGAPPAVSVQVLGLCLENLSRTGDGAVLSSHHYDLAKRLVDRMISQYSGGSVESGTTKLLESMVELHIRCGEYQFADRCVTGLLNRKLTFGECERLVRTYLGRREYTIQVDEHLVATLRLHVTPDKAEAFRVRIEERHSKTRRIYPPASN